MDIYLNVEFGETIDEGLLYTIANELTFDGIRVPVRSNLNTLRLLSSCKENFLKLILLVPDEERSSNQEEDLINEVNDLVGTILNSNYPRLDLSIEIVNEPQVFNEFWQVNPEQLGHAFNRCIDILRTIFPSMEILSPSIKNLGTEDINYLRRMYSTIDLSKNFIVSVHRYSANLGDWETPHNNYSTRDQEIEALQDIIKSRKYMITETGCSQNYRQDRFLICDKIINLSEKDQTDYLEKEINYWKEKSVETMVWYQINDGPDRKEKEDGFGIRRFDLTPKDIWNKLPELITIAHRS